MAINIDKFLADGENVLAEYKTKKQRFYATDRRLIWSQRGNFLDASYNHVTTIGMKEIKFKALIVTGVILFLLGIVLAVIGGGLGVAVIVIGLILIILYFIYKKADYTISLSSGQTIPIPRTKSNNAETFIKAIRDKVR